MLLLTLPTEVLEVIVKHATELVRFVATLLGRVTRTTRSSDLYSES